MKQYRIVWYTVPLCTTIIAIWCKLHTLKYPSNLQVCHMQCPSLWLVSKLHERRSSRRSRRSRNRRVGMPGTNSRQREASVSLAALSPSQGRRRRDESRRGRRRRREKSQGDCIALPRRSDPHSFGWSQPKRLQERQSQSKSWTLSFISFIYSWHSLANRYFFSGRCSKSCFVFCYLVVQYVTRFKTVSFRFRFCWGKNTS